MLYLYGVAVIFAAKPLAGSMPFWEMIFCWLEAVFYTVGAALYGIGKKRKYVHSLWHLFVLAGSIFHFFCIYGCAMPNFWVGLLLMMAFCVYIKIFPVISSAGDFKSLFLPALNFGNCNVFKVYQTGSYRSVR